MRSNFEATASVSVQNDAKNLVEFCVFRYLVRSGADVHPSLWVNILSDPFCCSLRASLLFFTKEMPLLRVCHSEFRECDSMNDMNLIIASFRLMKSKGIFSVIVRGAVGRTVMATLTWTF